MATILPELAAACPDIDWTQPLGAWPRETMVEFLLVAMQLIRKAMIARDISERGITQKSSADTIARQANAATGGPLMTPDEPSEPDGSVSPSAFAVLRLSASSNLVGCMTGSPFKMRPACKCDNISSVDAWSAENLAHALS